MAITARNAAAVESSTAIHGVPLRLVREAALFYLLSIFFVVALVPWNAPGLVEQGSWQTVLQAMNIPHARLIVDLVVLMAVCSCLNSALYTSSRMLYSHRLP